MIEHQQIDALTFQVRRQYVIILMKDLLQFKWYLAIGEQTARTIKYQQPVTIAEIQTLESLIERISRVGLKMKFDRHRRLRSSATMRDMVRENHVRKEDLIYPIFVVEKDDVKKEIKSLPGVYQISLNLLESELKEAYDLGIRAIMFFGVPN